MKTVEKRESLIEMSSSTGATASRREYRWVKERARYVPNGFLEDRLGGKFLRDLPRVIEDCPLSRQSAAITHRCTVNWASLIGNRIISDTRYLAPTHEA